MSSNFPLLPPTAQLPEAPQTEDGWPQRITKGVHEAYKKLVIRLEDALRQVISAPTTLTLANGLNSNIAQPIGTGPSVRIVGPAAAFQVGGVAGGQSGRRLVLRNTTAQQCTIVNLDAGSAAANQIYTMTGANVVQVAGNGSVFELLYESQIPGWVLMSNKP